MNSLASWTSQFPSEAASNGLANKCKERQVCLLILCVQDEEHLFLAAAAGTSKGGRGACAAPHRRFSNRAQSGRRGRVAGGESM